MPKHKKSGTFSTAFHIIKERFQQFVLSTHLRILFFPPISNPWTFVTFAHLFQCSTARVKGVKITFQTYMDGFRWINCLMSHCFFLFGFPFASLQKLCQIVCFRSFLILLLFASNVVGQFHNQIPNLIFTSHHFDKLFVFAFASVCHLLNCGQIII